MDARERRYEKLTTAMSASMRSGLPPAVSNIAQYFK